MGIVLLTKFGREAALRAIATKVGGRGVLPGVAVLRSCPKRRDRASEDGFGSGSEHTTGVGFDWRTWDDGGSVPRVTSGCVRRSRGARNGRKKLDAHHHSDQTLLATQQRSQKLSDHCRLGVSHGKWLDRRSVEIATAKG